MQTDRLVIDGGFPVVPQGAHRPWPDITDEDQEAVRAVLDRGELGGTAPVVTGLEEDYAAYCRANYVVALQSGTAALHSALVACGVRPGDEVITSAYSMNATAMAIYHARATPVFCDVSPDTGNLDPALIPALITPRTTAILVVHIHGTPAEMKPVNAIAAEHGLAVIEDAAQAHGSTYHGQTAGTLADGAAFSLAKKNLHAGEGGLFVTNDPTAARCARRLASFGEDLPPLTSPHERGFVSYGVGYQYRMPAMTAALARSRLRRLDRHNPTARRNAEILTTGLAGLPGIDPPPTPAGVETTWWKYRVRLDAKRLGWHGSAVELRDRFIYALAAEGVPVGTWQRYPLPALPACRRGRALPWTPDLDSEPLTPWRPDSYPQASALLDGSFILGAERQAIYVQTQATMRAYVAAVAKVLAHLPVIFHCEYTPVRPFPPLPGTETLHGEHPS